MAEESDRRWIKNYQHSQIYKRADARIGKNENMQTQNMFILLHRKKIQCKLHFVNAEIECFSRERREIVFSVSMSSIEVGQVDRRDEEQSMVTEKRGC